MNSSKKARENGFRNDTNIITGEEVIDRNNLIQAFRRNTLA